MERDAVSSSESEDDKEDKKITVAYKSTRSAVRDDFLSYTSFCVWKMYSFMNVFLSSDDDPQSHDAIKVVQ